MRRAIFAVVLALVLAGCAAPVATDDDRTLEDGQGVVDGISADQRLSITVEDGFNESELSRLVKRSMARIELIRDLEFERTVGVDIVTREEYTTGQVRGEPNKTASLWNNQVWESIFIVGEDRNVTSVFNRTYGTSVQGFYSPQDEQIVIVSDSETPTVDTNTLVHELVHALQDQQFGLDTVPKTQDSQLARNGVVEGEANLVPQLYFDRCGAEWSCVDPETGGGSSGQADRGLLLVIIHPYQQGPTFVEAVREKGGWDAVDRLHDDLPASTEQVIHPEKYPDEGPVNVEVADRSNEKWSRFDHDPVGETLGEASIYAMFLHNRIIEVDAPYGYDHPVSAGWAGDTLVPYRNGEEFGYVWQTEWDSRQDAEQFYNTYVAMLEGKGAQERGQRSFLLEDGSFADAFRVTLEGRTVRIVNGPTVDSLSEIDG